MVWLHPAVVCLALAGVGRTELLDFSATWCGPCRQMEPIVAGLAAAGHPVRKVDIDHERELAQRYRVSAVPCFVMLVDGQEVDRVVGGASRARLEQMLARAPRPGAGGVAAPRGPTLRGQSPDVPSAAARLPAQSGAAPLTFATAGNRAAPHEPALDNAAAALDATKQSADRCLAASVRLRIADERGNSVGSGTIIDARDGEALVLTCGHVFRDSQGKGRITIDMFGPGAPKGLQGEMVGYDEKCDVGLVSFRPGVPVTTARLAGREFEPKPGDRVINVGCDNGREPTAHASQVTSINKFQGPPNLQVAGQPVEGRSGGGLFTSDGTVIGVCNAADPTDNEGLYAALGSIHPLVDRLGLTELVGQRGPDGTALAAGDPPRMPASMPPLTDQPPLPAVHPTSAELPAGMSPAATADAAALAQLRDAHRGAEVICIVRSLDAPGAKSEVIVLDRASPELLRQLAADRAAQRPAHLTTLASPPAARQPQITSSSWQPHVGPARR